MPAKAAEHPKTAPAALGRAPQKGDHVFLVDGSGYIFRAYHALPPLSRKSDGLQLNAVYGFCNMLWKLLRDMKPEERPTHLAIVFDKSEKTFRTDFYPDYKAHRPDPPDDLIPQFRYIREAVHAFDLPCIEQAGFEADDLIATYARLACEVGASATIVSSDKDLMQLVNDCVIMYDTMKDKKIGIAEVIEKFGVPPKKVIEVQSLIGDSTDNVPGVPGIGVKTAAQLIGEYGDLETLLARASEIKQDKRRQTLIDNAEKARLSKRLVTLDDKVALDVPIDDIAVHEPDYKRADRLSQGDGVHFAHAPRRGILRRRCRRDRGGSRAGQAAARTFPSPACGGSREGPGPAAPDSRQAPSYPPPEAREEAPGARAARPSWRTRPRSLRKRSRRSACRRRTTPRSTARATRSCARSTGSTPGSSARTTSERSRSMPRPPASTRCRRTCAASRWRSRRTRPATCRLRTARAATAAARACSKAASRPISFPRRRR